jgi:transcriptional regulator with XRE-family HTH domain
MARKKHPDTTAISKVIQRRFGERLKRARDGGNTKQHTLAADLHLTRTSVSNIERGRHRIFLDQVYIAAHSLGVPLEELLPLLSEVFPEDKVSFASDAAVSHDSAKVVTEIAQGLREHLGEKKPARPSTQRRI